MALIAQQRMGPKRVFPEGSKGGVFPIELRVLREPVGSRGSRRRGRVHHFFLKQIFFSPLGHALLEPIP
jgi:hypothetical protein